MTSAINGEPFAPPASVAQDGAEVRARWDAALRKYQLAQILYDADDSFGPMARATRQWDDEQARLGHEYGSWDRAKATPDGKVRAERARQRFSEAEQASSQAFLFPLWAAMRELARTPAPNTAAVQLKLALIDKEEVWNDCYLEEDCFDIIQADVERLRGEVL